MGGKSIPGCLSGCTWDPNFSRRALVCHCHEPLQLLSPQYESLNQWLGNNTRTPLCTEHTEGREKEPENRMLSQITEVCPAWGLKMSRVCGDRQPEVCLHEDRGASWEILILRRSESGHCGLDLLGTKSELRERREAHIHHGICHPDSSLIQSGKDNTSGTALGTP